MTERSVVVRIRAEVADAKRQIQDLGSTTKATAAQFDSSGKAIESSSGRMIRSAQVNAKEWRTAGLALSTFGLATVAALAASTKAAVDWESAWTGVSKTVDGTSEQMSSLQGDLRSMARTLPATHDDIAGVAEAAGQLGVRVQDISSFTKVMIDLGQTTNLTASDAATSLAQLMNIMQTAPGKVSNLGAAVVALGNNGASTERDIVTMAQRIAGAGRIIGLSEGDVLGLSNALASVGIDAEAGGSSVSKIMTDIASDVSKGGTKVQAWAQIAGMSAQQFTQAWKNAPANALTSVIEGLGRLSAAGGDVFGTLDTLGQTDVRTTRALLSLANSGDLLANSIQLGNQAWKDNTALLEEANKRYDTTASKVAVARNNIVDAGISLGETFLPAIEDAARRVSDLAGAVARMPAPVASAVAHLGLLAGGVAVLGGGLLTAAPRIASTAVSLRELSAAGSRIPGIFTGIGRSAGIAVAALAGFTAVTATVEGLSKAGDTAGMSASVATQALLKMKTVGDLNSAFDGVGIGVDRVHDLEDAFQRIAAPGLMDRVQDFSGSVRGIFGGGRTARTETLDQIKALGQGLATMVQYGHADQAAAQFDQLRDAWVRAGGDAATFINLMPAYRDALADVQNQQKLVNQATGSGVTLQQQYAASVGVSVDQMQAYADQLNQWKASAAQADAGFIDPLTAYNTLLDVAQQKEQARAQKIADYSRSTKDTWQDYTKTATVSIGSVLKSMQAEVDAQNAWEQNLSKLAGRGAGEDVIGYLTGQGQQGAPLVAALATASDAQLAQFKSLYSQAGSDATGAFADGLASKAVEPIDVWANDQPARSTLDRLVADYAGTQISFLAVVKPTGAVGAHPDLTTPSNSALVRANPAAGLNPWQSGGGGSAAGLNPWQSQGTFSPTNGFNPWQSGGGAPQVTVHESVTENTPIYIDHVTTTGSSDLVDQAGASRARAVVGLRPVAF